MGFYLDEESAPATTIPSGFFIDETPVTAPSSFLDTAKSYLAPENLSKVGQALINPFGAMANAVDPRTATASAMNALPFEAGDEIVAAPNALFDAWFSQNAQGGQDLSIQQAYDERLNQARGIRESFAAENPMMDVATKIGGAVAMPFPKMSGGALANILKATGAGAGIGGVTAFGAGEGVDERLQGLETGAKWGGALGGGLQTLLQGGAAIAPKVQSWADDIYGSVLGKSPTAKQKIAGFVDAQGNKVSEAVAGGKQVGVLDQKFEDLLESGFKDTLKASDSASDVANKVSLFKQEAGKTIGSVIDDAVKVEDELMASAAPWQKAEYFKKASPDFAKAEKLVDDIKDLAPTDGRALAKKLKDIKRYWDNSDQSLSTFKKLQEKFGLLNKKSFNQGLSEVDQLKVQLNNRIYGDLAGSLKSRLSILEKEGGLTGLVDKFTTANKQFASASTFEPLAFNASKKFGVGGALKELGSLRSIGGGIVGGGAAALGIPGLAPVIAAERAAALGTKLAPVRAAKTLESVASGLKNNNLSRLTAVGANLAGAANAIKAPKESIDRAMDRAEMKLNTPKEKEEFNTKVNTISEELGAKPEHLMKVMKFETGGTLDSAQKNKAGSGATGLIQFMPATAKELTKADTKEAAIKLMESMTPTEQLDYVKKYLAPFKGKIDTLEDLYMAILYPKAVGKSSEFALFKEGTKAYWQNRGLDLDKDGVITKSEAAHKVKTYKI